METSTFRKEDGDSDLIVMMGDSGEGGGDAGEEGERYCSGHAFW